MQNRGMHQEGEVFSSRAHNTTQSIQLHPPLEATSAAYSHCQPSTTQQTSGHTGCGPTSLTLGTGMAAGLAEARGAGTGVILATRQAEMCTAPVVGPTTVSPCSSSQRQKQPRIKQRVKEKRKNTSRGTKSHMDNIT